VPYWKLKGLAEAQFGKCYARPQDVFPETMRRARMINNGVITDSIETVSTEVTAKIMDYRLLKANDITSAPYSPLKKYIDVGTEDEFEIMMNDVLGSQEISVDLECNSADSFAGEFLKISF